MHLYETPKMKIFIFLSPKTPYHSWCDYCESRPASSWGFILTYIPVKRQTLNEVTNLIGVRPSQSSPYSYSLTIILPTFYTFIFRFSIFVIISSRAIISASFEKRFRVPLSLYSSCTRFCWPQSWLLLLRGLHMIPCTISQRNTPLHWQRAIWRQF